MNILICGSRSIKNHELIRSEMSDYLLQFKNPNDKITIYTGGAEGVDKIAKIYADQWGIDNIVMNANWNKFGKSAGMIRNKEMVILADSCLAIWDNKSNGTRNTVKLCIEKKIPIRVIKYEKFDITW